MCICALGNASASIGHAGASIGRVSASIGNARPYGVPRCAHRRARPWASGPELAGQSAGWVGRTPRRARPAHGPVDAVDARAATRAARAHRRLRVSDLHVQVVVNLLALAISWP